MFLFYIKTNRIPNRIHFNNFVFAVKDAVYYMYVAIATRIVSRVKISFLGRKLTWYFINIK